MRVIVAYVLVLLASLASAQNFTSQDPLTYFDLGVSSAVFFDVDQDGHKDLLYSHGNALAWSRYYSDNSFSTRRVLIDDFGSGGSIDEVDIDNDGDKDILSVSLLSTSGNYSSELRWYENQDGVLDTARHHIFTYSDLTSQFTVEDVGMDGDLDIITIGGYGTPLLFFENDSGSFQEPDTLLDFFTANKARMFIGEVNGDGIRDIILFEDCSNNTDVAWFPGTATGSFEDQQAPFMEDVCGTSVDAVDFDNNGNIDLLFHSSDGVPPFYDTAIQLLLNQGAGLMNYEPQFLMENSEDIAAITAHDFDNDGDYDILMNRNDNTGSRWMENLGAGSSWESHLLWSTNYETFKLLPVDYDGDGDTDILNLKTHGFELRRNNGSGSFSEISMNSYAKRVNSIEAVDIDQDGYNDLIFSSIQSNIEPNNYGVFSMIKFLPSQGDFAAVKHFSSGTLAPQDITTGDLDGDGDLDCAGVDGIGDVYTYSFDGESYLNQTIINNTSYGANSVEIGDINGDQYADIVVGSNGTQDNPGQKLSLFLNDGNGNFSGEQILSSDAWAQHIELIDIEGDGDLDIFYSSYLSFGGIGWMLNNGDGTFSLPGSLQNIPSFINDLRCVDLNNDDYPDLVFVDNYEGLMWCENLIDGTFTDPIVLDNQILISVSLEVSDFNNDGLMDIMVAGAALDEQQGVFYYSNYGGGLFSGQQFFPLEYAGVLTSADLDDDGDMDVALGINTVGYAVRWLENHVSDGCTDPVACNYSASSWIDDGSCCYFSCGCTTLGAENYNTSATCDDGSCGFIAIGTVYYDENEDGVQNNDESGLAGREVLLLPDSLTLITNGEGQFYVNASGEDYYSFHLAEDSLFPFNTTPQVLGFSASDSNWNQDISFGISNQAADFNLDLNIYSSWNTYPCDTISPHWVSFQNQGNMPIDGYLSLELDTLFQGYLLADLPDSIVENTIYFGFQNLLPSQNISFGIDLLTPTAEFLGNFLKTKACVYGYYENDQVAFGQDSLSIELTCAYDPNDKQVFPNGYTDAHFVPQGEDLEYLVRFQNTGNAPATDVIIRDTIDDGLDISTFELVANSHSVFTTLDPESREVEFYFQDIQLPDSVNNEPESHGLISYRVRPEEGLPLLTELNNTAYIFFDNNPPIVTNTTWSTTYNCTLFEVSFTQDGALLTASEGESYQWYLDGEVIEGATAPIFEAFVNGDYSVEISNEFPCSELTESVFVLVSGLEELNGASITLFPNPMTQSAILDLGELRGQAQVEIYDLSGKLMRSETLNIESGGLNLSRGALAAGAYLLRVIVDEEVMEISFVVE